MSDGALSVTPRLLEVKQPTAPGRLTHQLFRFPAKFHPPVVAELLDRYTGVGHVVLDPFVGSGTSLVEGAVKGRRLIGFDVDPIAATIAAAKTRRYDLDEVSRAVRALLNSLPDLERSPEEYKDRMLCDLLDNEYEKTVESERLPVPAIPKLHHWFRRYVIVDLARILSLVEAMSLSPTGRAFLMTVFGSIIRNSSNADPVPVSGLEYTAHMRRRDQSGRLVNPYALLRTALARAEAAVTEYVKALPADALDPVIGVADALALPLPSHSVDAVLTSPPYHNAVDYYRRHQLEMYWLGLVESQADRLRLLPRYIGKPHVPAKNPLFARPWNPSPIAATWEQRIRTHDDRRANDFIHYVHSMTIAFSELGRVTQVGSPILMVVGRSGWNGDRIPTDLLFAELAKDFTLEETFYYPVKNRYMSYSRHNGASIETEYVLVFRRN